MSSWGTRRRNMVILIFLSGVFVLLAIFGYSFFYREPTCFDGIQNQGEAGVDCGGPCELLCSHEALDPVVKWSRNFEVVPGIYNAVAYLENQNSNARTDNIRYKFTLYDPNSAILNEKYGSITMRPNEVVPIVENALSTGVMIPARMTFEIVENITWKRGSVKEPVIRVRNEQITHVNASPRVTASLENTGFAHIQDVTAVVILYNDEANAIGVSSTYVDEIQSNQSRNILFTWPQGFVGEVARFEIIPLYESR